MWFRLKQKLVGRSVAWRPQGDYLLSCIIRSDTGLDKVASRLCILYSSGYPSGSSFYFLYFNIFWARKQTNNAIQTERSSQGLVAPVINVNSVNTENSNIFTKAEQWIVALILELRRRTNFFCFFPVKVCLPLQIKSKYCKSRRNVISHWWMKVNFFVIDSHYYHWKAVNLSSINKLKSQSTDMAEVKLEFVDIKLQLPVVMTYNNPPYGRHIVRLKFPHIWSSLFGRECSFLLQMAMKNLKRNSM